MKVLQVDRLSKTFSVGGKLTPALNDVSFHIEQGEVLALLGKNGAGKTTAIKIVTGIMTADSGSVSIERQHGTTRHRPPVGAVLDGSKNLYGRLNALENLEYFGVMRGLRMREARAKGKALLQKFGLDAKAGAPVQTLSRGMQQKLAIVVSLVHEPRLLVLDEPTLGVDYEGTQALLQLIKDLRAEGLAVLLTTHQLEIAEQMSDRTAILHQGRKVADALTTKIKGEFAADSYQIDFQGSLAEPVLQALTHRFRAHVSGQMLSFTGSAEQLYHVLGMLSPTPIMRVVRGDFGLSAAFVNYTR
jgi:ABC-2 type transport system ATP-binding protein